MTPEQIVVARAPEYEGAANLKNLLSLAEAQTGTDWGAMRNTAVALLVLHWLAVAQKGGAPGAVISESEGQLSRSYAAPASSGPMGSTSWGMELQQLRRQSFVGFGNRMTL